MTIQSQSAPAPLLTRKDKRLVGTVVTGWGLILFGLYCFWPSYREAINSLILLILQQLALIPLPTTVHQFLTHEAQTMGLPLSADTQAYWFVARAGGILAYLLLWFAALWGIVMSSKMTKGVIDAAFIYGLHEFFPMLAITFAVIHAGVLLYDSYIGFTLTEILLPFTSQYQPLWTGLGTLAFYLIIALIASFYLRKWIGQKTWRAFHYITYLTVGLALVHGLMMGSDSQLTSIRAMYIATGALLLFATCYRILTVKPWMSFARAKTPRAQHGEDSVFSLIPEES